MIAKDRASIGCPAEVLAVVRALGVAVETLGEAWGVYLERLVAAAEPAAAAGDWRTVDAVLEWGPKVVSASLRAQMRARGLAPLLDEAHEVEAASAKEASPVEALVH